MEELLSLNKKKLGFGLMRLPKDSNGNIDEKRTAAMVDRFLSEGFTYFDTAYAYQGSEEMFRKTIGSRYSRDSYTIATKLPSGPLGEGASPEELFRTQLERTGLEYFDFYLLHSINPLRLPERFSQEIRDLVRQLYQPLRLMLYRI